MRTGIITLIAIAAALTAGCSKENKEKGNSDPLPEQALAKEAYIYAFAAVEHNKAIYSTMAATTANAFIANTELFTYENTVVVSPNNDTFYSYAVCDLRYEPVVISVPLIEKRYFCLQLCDMFTNCPDYVSTLATGEGPGNYLIANSEWEDAPPPGIDKVIKIPATVVLVIGRTQVFGTDDENAGPIAKGYRAAALSRFTGTTPPSGDALTWTYPMYDSKTGDVEGFFRTFNDMVQYQILDAKDKTLMEKFKAIGLGAGKDFAKSQFSAEVWAAIEAGAKEAKAEIEAATGTIGKAVNGWHYAPANSGDWGTDYLTRAAAAWKYIYVNTPEEAVYLTVDNDSDGNPLNGANDYTINFNAEQIPDPQFFWSLTMYNDKGFLVENTEGRYNIKGGDELTYNPENPSLTLYIQKDNPGELYAKNWLPAPEGQFYMILRMYGPNEETIKGEAVIPAVVKTK
ncbi:DUF1254 domain-containing protein [uncultured Alistipes sp.]|uniref:DUF1254 domain-containing protein n=1 Tax=uncultured Alistipes sp. TaxID=538949 RepID=UPI0025D205F0|nr:DUF1254 domain-containing protein [uncultured Alistipes sp.]